MLFEFVNFIECNAHWLLGVGFLGLFVGMMLIPENPDEY